MSETGIRTRHIGRAETEVIGVVSSVNGIDGRTRKAPVVQVRIFLDVTGSKEANAIVDVGVIRFFLERAGTGLVHLHVSGKFLVGSGDNEIELRVGIAELAYVSPQTVVYLYV